MKIFKFPLLLTDWQTVKLSPNSKILTAQMQRGQLCLWAQCHEGPMKESRLIALYGTGNPMPDNPGEYIATVQITDCLVLHVYEAKE